MRNPDGTLNGDLNDNIPAYVSGTIGRIGLSTTNENETVYDLLPVFVNKPPIIVNPITEASTPPIKPYATANATGEAMYLFPDGSVKVKLGATFTFRLQAQQPSIFNVENGIPTMLPPNQGLTYVWRKDGNVITSYTNDPLRSVLTVNNNELTFTNIQPEHAGSYVCEVQNDIGSTTSETINLEILNLDFDEYFYKNLVKNPYGKNGTEDWETSSEDFITKQLSDTPSQDFKRPNRVDIFGYTPDMMYPRPYQIDYGVLRGFDMTDALVSNRGSYFTTNRFKFLQKGGVPLVRAYQDIDLADIESLIKGGVFGVEGVRAIFSCYIGNALSDFNPVQELATISERTNPLNYSMRDPRVSVENTLKAGSPGFPIQLVKVYVEEFDNDTRLSSTLLNNNTTRFYSERVSINDPWYGNGYDTIWKWYSSSYKAYPDTTLPPNVNVQTKYPTDVYGVGPSKGNFLDMVLMRARELSPDRTQTYTYGQHVKFNKLVFERLNPKTTKVRITMDFICENGRLFETWKEAFDSSDEVFEIAQWTFPWKRGTWGTTYDFDPSTARPTVQILKEQDRRSNGTDFKQFLKSAEDPRGMVTAINFALLPVLTQDPNVTIQQTNNTLVQNDTSASFVPDVLGAFGRPFDPLGVTTSKLKVYFKFKSGAEVNDYGLIEDVDQLSVNFDYMLPSNVVVNSIPATTDGLFPFQNRSTVYLDGIDSIVEPTDLGVKLAIRRYAKYRYIKMYNENGEINNIKTDYSSPYAESTQQLKSLGYLVDTGSVWIPSSNMEVPAEWNGKTRFYAAFALPESGVGRVNTQLLNTSYTDYPDYTNTYTSEFAFSHSFAMIGYYLDFDFSDQYNTKVYLMQSGSALYPPAKSSSPTSAYNLPVSYSLEHSIDNGVLVCKLPTSLISSSMAVGGMGYKTIKDVLERTQLGTGIIPQPDMSGTGEDGTGEAVVGYSNHPLECTTFLRANLKPWSFTPDIRTNFYYKTRIEQILQPIDDRISQLQQITTPQADDLTELSNLRYFTGSIIDYAYSNDALPDTSDISAIINNNYNTRITIDLTNETFTNQATYNNYNTSFSNTTTSKQTARPPHLLNMRVFSEKNSPSLMIMRSVDPASNPDKLGSPSFAKMSNGDDSIVMYAPIQDKVAGTYL